ncbi:MAG TPA: acyl-CoA dehydrogenase family protein [Polyangia bacterium]|nr:acyl-CoA dehydrogenase family protein [Polyangia bacterium]
MRHAYGLDEAAEKYRDKAAQLAAGVLAPNAAKVDETASFPEAGVAALAAQGFFGLTVARPLGGVGLGPRAFAAVVEELAMGCSSTAMIYVMHVCATQAIASGEKLAGRDHLLGQIAAGKHLTTLALSEKGSRSQFWAPVSKLVAHGRDFRVSAQKSWVTSAHHADSFVSASQKPGAASPLESTCFLVHPKSPGVRFPAQFNGLGLRGNDSAPVTLEDYAVAAGDLVSAPGEGLKTELEVVLPWFNVGTAAMSNGLARAAVAATAKHLAETGFEHSDSRLRDLPTLRARLAQMAIRTEQSRALLNYTIGEVEAPSETTPLFVLETRAAALEAAADVTDLAMKACGGAAFSRHLGVERLFRDARAGWVMAPTVDHLHDFLGKALTGMPLF